MTHIKANRVFVDKGVVHLANCLATGPGYATELLDNIPKSEAFVMRDTTDGTVHLEIDGHRRTFHSVADFEFCLDARTQVPASKMVALTRQPPELLHEEARNIRKVEQRFSDTLARSMDDANTLAKSMQELDKQLFSQDFRWRSIMVAINSLPDREGGYRRAAMVRYLHYLRSRQESLREAYVEQRRRDDTPPLAESNMDSEGAVPSALRETSIFDVADIPSTVAGADGFADLLRGETVKVRVQSEPLPVLLSSHVFELVFGNELGLRDDEGKVYPLRGGRNVIGRGLDNDVVIDAGYRDVSRRHLIVEANTSDWLQLTDLSSHGTRVAVPK